MTSRQPSLELRAAADPVDIQLTCGADLNLVCAEGESAGPPTFSARAYNGGVMRVAKFQYPVIVDLKGVETAADTIPVLRNHNDDRVVGHSTVEIAEQINAAGVVSADNEHSREIITAAKNGFPWQISIGGRVIRYDTIRAGQTALVNGQTVNGPVIVAREFLLSEISVLPRGADSRTSLQIAATHVTESGIMAEFAGWLEFRGFTADEFAQLPPRSQKSLLARFAAP